MTMTKPVMIYDGECGFCRQWIRRWELATGDRIDYVPFQEAAPRLAHIPREQLEEAVHLVEPDGTISRGAHAVFRTLFLGADRRWPLWLYEHMPLFALFSQGVYSFVARHRRGLSTWTRMMWGAHIDPPSYRLTRWLFIRLLGAIYLIAFLSLGVQILGLIGSHGILPATQYLTFLHQRLGDEAYRRVPTLAWFLCSDQALQWSCWIGAGLSLLVILRIAPGPLLLILWALYLSLYHVGQTFLTFQWDLLLLEAGFVGMFFASWQFWPGLANEAPPSRVMRWLIWWLLFRLMFCSGVVKLLDDNPHNPTWHQLTALHYHYETTCIPTPLSWYAHKLPDWFQKFSVVTMFVIEIGVPFLIFWPRRLRLLAFVFLVFFQILIMLTGNYNFFNLLTITLCLSLLDDAYLGRIFPKRFRQINRAAGFSPREAPRKLEYAARYRWRTPLFMRMIRGAVAVVILPVTGIWMVETFVHYRNLPPTMQRVLQVSMRFGSINNYGLFRSMTTRRPEIIVEGSDDGRTWKAYEFKWKPGNVKRRPPVVQPHQPRLDWQMWFAALGNIRTIRNRWVIRFAQRLLEGSPPVLALLEMNPFPDQPPRYVRAVLYDYHFTDWDTRRRTGAWWTRKRLGLYLQPVSLQSFRR